MAAHARLSPSSAQFSGGWTKCSGYPNFRSRILLYEETSEYAERGTAVHELIEHSFKCKGRPSRYKGVTFNGFEMNDEDIEAAEVCYNFVMSAKRKYNYALIPERRVNPGRMFERDDCWGTADISLVGPSNIMILDYKNGAGHVHDIENHLQTLLYGIGALNSVALNARRKIKFITIGIIQPNAPHRDGPVRCMTYPIEQIYQWIEFFREKARRTDDPEANLTPGKEQCLMCDAAPVCPQRHKDIHRALSVANDKQVQTMVLREPQQLTVEQIARVLEYKDLIEAFLKKVASHAKRMMDNGQALPGWKLVEGRKGNRKITDERIFIDTLTEEFGVNESDIYQDPKLSPIDKLLRLAKTSDDFNENKYTELEELIHRPDGKPSLVLESDPKPAIGSFRARKAFANVKLPENKK